MAEGDGGEKKHQRRRYYQPIDERNRSPPPVKDLVGFPSLTQLFRRRSNLSVGSYSSVPTAQFADLNGFVKVYTAKKKISKDKGTEPIEFEESIAQALFNLENTNTELKSDMMDLYINAFV